MADHFHDVYWQIFAVKTGMDPNGETYKKLEAKQKMAAKLMNRGLDNAHKQGFGDL